MSEAKVGARGRRGAYAQGRATQETILDAARAVFAVKGFRGGSLRDIATAADVTSGTILHHFTSKEDLLVAVLERRDFILDDVAPPQLEAGDFADLALDIVERNARDRLGVKLYMTLMAESLTPEHPAHAFFVKRYDWLRGTIAEALAVIPATKSLSSDELMRRSAVIVAVMDGLQAQWLLDESLDMSTAFRSYLASSGLLDATAAPPPESERGGEPPHDAGG